MVSKRMKRCSVVQEINPKTKCLVFWNSAVDAIEQLLVLVFDCLSPNIALCSGTREGPTFDDDNVFCGGDALVDIATRMKLPRPSDDFLLEPLGVHGARLGSLDEQGGGRSAVANDDTLENKFTTGSAEVVLDRPELVRR